MSAASDAGRRAPSTRPLQGARLGSKLALSRLGWRAPLAIVLVCLTFAAIAATSLARSAPLEAPDRVIGLVLRWVVPLSAFALCGGVVGRMRVDDSVWSIVVHGYARRHVVMGLACVAIAISAAVAALTAGAAMVLAYRGMPGWGADMSTSVWIAALGGACYTSWFLLGASFFRNGRGRWMPLVLDFVLGATHGVFSVPFPRGHLANLAGGEGVLEMSQQTSSLLLATMGAVVLILAAMRAGD